MPFIFQIMPQKEMIVRGFFYDPLHLGYSLIYTITLHCCRFFQPFRCFLEQLHLTISVCRIPIMHRQFMPSHLQRWQIITDI